MVEQIVRVLSGWNYKPCRTEAQFEEQVVARLNKHGISFQRQFVASEDDRFDILIEGGIVLELKIKGSTSEVLRQVERYAQHDCVTAILVVTTRPAHRRVANVETLYGKWVGVLHVGWI